MRAPKVTAGTSFSMPITPLGTERAALSRHGVDRLRGMAVLWKCLVTILWVSTVLWTLEQIMATQVFGI